MDGFVWMDLCEWVDLHALMSRAVFEGNGSHAFVWRNWFAMGVFECIYLYAFI